MLEFEVKDNTQFSYVIWAFIDLAVRSFMATVTFLGLLYIFLSDCSSLSLACYLFSFKVNSVHVYFDQSY